MIKYRTMHIKASNASPCLYVSVFPVSYRKEDPLYLLAHLSVHLSTSLTVIRYHIKEKHAKVFQLQHV